jgi:hypothetical protein
MDTPEIIAVVLLLSLVGGVVFYLFHQRTQLQRPILNARRPEIERSSGRQAEIQRDFQRVFSMTSAQGRENLIQASDGPQRLRPHGSHAAGNRRVAAG